MLHLAGTLRRLAGHLTAGHNSEKMLWLLAALLLIASATWIGVNMQALGFRIEQPEIELDYVLGVLWWGIFAAAIILFGREFRQMLMVAWVAKFFVVLVFMLFYEQHYGLDSYTYFKLKVTGQHWLYTGVDFRDDMIPRLSPAYYTTSGLPVQEGGEGLPSIGSENTLRLLLWVSSVTGPFYHPMKVACAFLGLMATWFYYRASVVVMGRESPPVFYLLAFFPSIIFWSSTLGKDPLQFLFLSFYAYGGAMWLVQGRLSSMGFIGAGLFCSYLLRPWISIQAGLAILLATVLGRSKGWQLGFMLVVAAPALYVSGNKALGFFNFSDPAMIVDVVQSLMVGYATDATGDTDMMLAGGEMTVAASLPWAMFSGLFRPLPFDISNPFTALAAAENTVVLLLAVIAICHFRLAYLRDPLVLWAAAYTLMWTSIHGFIVMVNFGSGVRYKLQIWPFLLFVVIILAHKQGRALLEFRLPPWERSVKTSA